MGNIKFLIVAGLALGMVQPALAQSKVDQKTKGGVQEGAQEAIDPSGQMIEDAQNLCALVVDNDGAVLDALESGGWESEVTYDIGNAPFYKEISANQSYEGVGDADLWGFLEEYPGYWIGYCSFSVPTPQSNVSLAPINNRDDLVGNVELDGSSTFGTWRDIGEKPSTFIHSYVTGDEFYYQVTKLTNLEAR
jgi:hypothetical protein